MLSVWGKSQRATCGAAPFATGFESLGLHFAAVNGPPSQSEGEQVVQPAENTGKTEARSHAAIDPHSSDSSGHDCATYSMVKQTVKSDGKLHRAAVGPVVGNDTCLLTHAAIRLGFAVEPA